MDNNQSPSYIKALLKPSSTKGTSRKVWSVDLEAVWLPFFTASNVNGDTNISKEALGAPLRLAKNDDGTAKFSKSGRPVLRVAPELGAQIKVVRENFVAGLVSYTNNVIHAKPDEFKAEVEACNATGKPINDQANDDIDKAIQAQIKSAQEEAEKIMRSSGEKVPA